MGFGLWRVVVDFWRDHPAHEIGFPLTKDLMLSQYQLVGFVIFLIGVFAGMYVRRKARRECSKVVDGKTITNSFNKPLSAKLKGA